MGRPIVVEVAEAVANAEGVNSTELGYALEDYISTDALEMLAAHDGSEWTLSFDLPNHEVTITSDGLVLVDGERENRVDLNPRRPDEDLY